MEHIAFDEVTFEGAPAVYDHSSAFGAWGPILVEVTQVHDAQPAGLAARAHAARRRASATSPGSPTTSRPRPRAWRRPASTASTPAAPARCRPPGSTARRSATPSRCCSAARRCSASTRCCARRPRVGRERSVPPPMTDVTVIGFGPAGASAAIAAHDAGARVTVLERMPYGGGNCAQLGRLPVDVDGPRAVDHLDALCFGKTPRDVLEAFADGLHEVPAWLAVAGRRDPRGQIPGLPAVVAALPGRARDLPPVRRRPARPGAVRLPAPRGRGARDRGPLRRRASPSSRRARSCWRAAASSTTRNCATPTCRSRSTAVGHPGNTGDGDPARAAAGASLWHMSAFFGWFAFRHPDHVAAFPLDVHAPSFIYVDADGRRFADETGWEVHDKLRCLTAYLPRRRNHPHLPGYLIFDERGAARRPAQRHRRHAQRLRLERGQLRRAGRGLDQAGRGARPAASSSARCASTAPSPTSSAATRARSSRSSRRCTRSRCDPGVATASGGPRRDARARVLRRDGTPIPGLYAAGGCGSIWGAPDRARRRADRRDRVRPHRREQAAAAS